MGFVGLIIDKKKILIHFLFTNCKLHTQGKLKIALHSKLTNSKSIFDLISKDIFSICREGSVGR